MLSTHTLLFYQLLPSYQTFVIFLTVFIFSRLCYALTSYVIYVPYMCSCSTHQKHNYLPHLTVHTPSATIHLSNSLLPMPKWIEVFLTKGWCSSSTTILTLRSLFVRFGLPEMIFSDNDTAFLNAKFKEFVEKNGMRHLISAP